jgi:hypothetical protein
MNTDKQSCRSSLPLVLFYKKSLKRVLHIEMKEYFTVIQSHMEKSDLNKSISNYIS